MATVVNVKVAHIRPRYVNLREWCEDPANVYIGRRGVVFVDGARFPPRDSPFANPFKVGKDGTREEVLVKYYWYIYEKLSNDPALYAEFLLLRGKNLGCWCKPEGCHGDVLVSLLNLVNPPTE